ncbi:MAG: hypothetical protein JWP89_2280 [Schlesneria sp.]|nr:hypothetical protein [Schlesneria sp.]
MNRITGFILFGSVAVTSFGGTSYDSTANAGWFWKGSRCKEACSEAESCVTPPMAPPQAPPTIPPIAPQAPAVFQTPQATSDISGPSESIGIRGFGIRVPECNLQLPTIQLPSIVRYRRGSEANFESARSPQIAGMAAMPSQLVPGGHSIPVAPITPPTAPPIAPPQPPAAPPTAPNCVPQAPGVPVTAADQQTVNELLETRRALEAYRQELAELKRALGSVQQTATDDPGVPPSPTVRRLSYPKQSGSDSGNQRRLEAKVVEAGYAEDEGVVPRRPVLLRDRRSRASEDDSARDSVDINHPIKAAGRAKATTAPNVGHSYLSDEKNPEPAGLGAWTLPAHK